MQRTSWAAGLELVGDDERLVAHAGLLPLRLLADRRAARQSPGSVQETDTRARSGNGGYPARGSGTKLKHGLERSKRNR